MIGAADALSGLAIEVDGIELRGDQRAGGPRWRSADSTREIWGEDWTWIADDLRRRLDHLGPDGIRVLVATDGDRLVSRRVARDARRAARLRGALGRIDPREPSWTRHLPRTGRAPATIARERGIRYLQVDASDDSRPILERLGFLALTTTTPYVWTPRR